MVLRLAEWQERGSGVGGKEKSGRGATGSDRLVSEQRREPTAEPCAECGPQKVCFSLDS